MELVVGRRPVARLLAFCSSPGIRPAPASPSPSTLVSLTTPACARVQSDPGTLAALTQDSPVRLSRDFWSRHLDRKYCEIRSTPTLDTGKLFKSTTDPHHKELWTDLGLFW